MLRPQCVELVSLAKGTNYMCTQRRQRNEGYTASDFYYSAIVVLVERGLLHGHITRSYKRTKDSNEQATRNLAWAEHGRQLAARVRFCPQNASAAPRNCSSCATCWCQQGPTGWRKQIWVCQMGFAQVRAARPCFAHECQHLPCI